MSLRIIPGVESSGSFSEEQTIRYTRRRRPRPTIQQFVDGIAAGERAILAQAITLAESTLPSDRELAEQVIERILPMSGQSVRVGITGVPGVGKSTFIESLGTHLTRELGQKVAVLAVDPSSSVSGGSILGDKTRMAKLSVDPDAFIRPSPSRGSLGGVAQRTREAILLCEAAGFSNIFVETVGVGQSETTVASMVDFFLLLMLAGAGDELQGIKRGIIEMSDLIAINKADGDNRVRADMARAEFSGALHLFPPQPNGWIPRVVTCSAATGSGIAEIWGTVLEYRDFTHASGHFVAKRRTQEHRWMFELVEQSLREQFMSDAGVKELLPQLEADVMAGQITSFRAARELLRASPFGANKE